MDVLSPSTHGALEGLEGYITKRKMILLVAFLLVSVIFALILHSDFCVNREGPRLRDYVSMVQSRTRGRATVAQRVSQYEGAARNRLKPYFERAKITYPPRQVIILTIKDRAIVELYAKGRSGQPVFVRSYPVLAASGALGPKLREGDKQVPEGVYLIESLNPNSAFHLSLRLNYPNPFDRDRGREDGRPNLGGDIMIHGNRVSIGCIAIGDTAIEELFVLSADVSLRHMKVVVCPVDFRRPSSPRMLPSSPPWVEELYGQLKREVASLPAPS